MIPEINRPKDFIFNQEGDYYILDPEDIIQIGDEYKAYASWTKSSLIGDKAGIIHRYRRKIVNNLNIEVPF